MAVHEPHAWVVGLETDDHVTINWHCHCGSLLRRAKVKWHIVQLLRLATM